MAVKYLRNGAGEFEFVWFSSIASRRITRGVVQFYEKIFIGSYNESIFTWSGKMEKTV